MKWCSGYSLVMPMAPCAWWAVLAAEVAAEQARTRAAAISKSGITRIGSPGGGIGGQAQERRVLGEMDQMRLHQLEPGHRAPNCSRSVV